jgi:iron transport multicopper oxidase
MIGKTVLGAFGGHCDLFNYTGMIVAVSTTPGAGQLNFQTQKLGLQD